MQYGGRANGKTAAMLAWLETFPEMKVAAPQDRVDELVSRGVDRGRIIVTGPEAKHRADERLWKAVDDA